MPSQAPTASADPLNWAEQPSLYRGRRVALTTKHEKERAIARPFRAGLGVEVLVPAGIDTDLLGTFTGEVERVGAPDEVALRKARLGMARLGLPFGLASEGSFGPHPHIPFVPAGHELLIFVDDERGLRVVEQALTTETNYAQTETATDDDLASFLSRVGFPAHGLIVRTTARDVPGEIYKGLTTPAAVREAIARCRARSRDGRARVETDMWAQMNPTRRRVIRRLAVRLARRLRRRCPACQAPGWGVVEVLVGLPCRWCAGPTDCVKGDILGCARCAERRERPRADGLREADPGQCAYCNP